MCLACYALGPMPCLPHRGSHPGQETLAARSPLLYLPSPTTLTRAPWPCRQQVNSTTALGGWPLPECFMASLCLAGFAGSPQMPPRGTAPVHLP